MPLNGKNVVSYTTDIETFILMVDHIYSTVCYIKVPADHAGLVPLGHAEEEGGVQGEAHRTLHHGQRREGAGEAGRRQHHKQEE